MLETDKSTPLYQQLYLDLKNSIQEGKYRPGDQLPSLRDLKAQYGVSRVTVRKAIELLEQDGYVKVEHGKGTFVTQTFANPNALVDFSFADQMLRKSKTTSSRLLSKELIAAQPEIAQAFQITPQTKLYRIRRLRFSNGTPIALDTSYLSPKFNPLLPHVDFSDRMLLEILQRFGVVIAQQQKTIQAYLATPPQLDALNLAPPAAILCVNRISYNQDEEVVEYTQSAFSGHQTILNLTTGEYELQGINSE